MDTQFKKNEIERELNTIVLTKSKDLPEGQFEAVISTPSLDRHGERVNVAGMTIPKGQVMKVYFNHLASGLNLPIGKWLKIWKRNGVLMGIAQMDMSDDFAVKVYKKILGGYIDSVSVSFKPEEYDGDTSTWTKSVMVEASVVGEPANPEAQITRKDLGFSEAEFTKALRVKLADNPFVGEPGKPTDAALQNAPMDKPADQPSVVPPPAPQPLEPDSADPPEELNPPVTPSEDGAGDTEIKAAYEELKSRLGAVEETLKASADVPSRKILIKLRGDAKMVDKAADELNKVLRITLKGKL